MNNFLSRKKFSLDKTHTVLLLIPYRADSLVVFKKFVKKLDYLFFYYNFLKNEDREECVQKML